MDYLLARWYIVKNLPADKLAALHGFEAAVYAYTAKKRRACARAKMLPPLWWQEGALWLRAEFKNFWLQNKNCPARLLNFKEELAQILSGGGLAPGTAEIFKDINLMHRCDLAINTANTARVKPRGPQPAQAAQHTKAALAAHHQPAP